MKQGLKEGAKKEAKKGVSRPKVYNRDYRKFLGHCRKTMHSVVTFIRLGWIRSQFIKH